MLLFAFKNQDSKEDCRNVQSTEKKSITKYHCKNSIFKENKHGLNKENGSSWKNTVNFFCIIIIIYSSYLLGHTNTFSPAIVILSAQRNIRFVNDIVGSPKFEKTVFSSEILIKTCRLPCNKTYRENITKCCNPNRYYGS